MNYDKYWQNLVIESRELVKASKGDDNAFVGVCRAKAIIAMDDEVQRLRVQISETRNLNTTQVVFGGAIQTGDYPG